ncbi:ribosomal protein L15E [Bradyrhizobium sp. CIR18]|nr:ribosomal protein L15E [Bradyrhizobium sp. CIR18]
MTDAFDRWIEWTKKPPGQRTGLPSEIHATVRSLPREHRADRQKVNAAVEHRAELDGPEGRRGFTSTTTRMERGGTWAKRNG